MCKDCRNAMLREKQKDPVWAAEKSKRDRRSYEKHKKKRLAACKAYYENNKDAVNRRNAEYIEKKYGGRNSAEFRQMRKRVSRAYYERNKDKYYWWGKQSFHRRKASEGAFSKEEWFEKCDEFGFRCAYCGADEPLTIDHVFPVALGGSSYISNIVPACETCNKQKQMFLWGLGHKLKRLPA